jgi:hypothetical protein
MAYDIKFNVAQTGAETIDQITAKMTVMKAQITATGLEMRQTANRVADAEKQMAEAVTAGHTKIADEISKVATEERAALDGLVVKQRELKASLEALTPATKSATAAQVEYTAATREQSEAAEAQAAATVQVTEATTRMVPAIAAANAEFALMEGRLPTRALGQMAVNVLGLGPLLQSLFPLLGAVAFVEVLGQMIGKVGDLYNKWDPVVKAETLALEQMKKLNAEYDKAASEDRTFKLDKIEREQGKAERLRAESGYAGADLVSDTDAVTILQRRIAEDNAKIKAGTSNRGNWDASGKAVDTLDRDALAALRHRDDVLRPQLETARELVTRDTSHVGDLQAKTIAAQKQQDDKEAREQREAGAPARELKKRQDQGVIGANKELGTLSAKELSDTEKIKADRQAIQDQLKADGLLTTARLAVEQAITAELLKQYQVKLDKDAVGIASAFGEWQITSAERQRRGLLEDLEHSRDPHEFDEYNKTEAAKRVAGGDLAASDSSQVRRQLQATIRANSARGGGPGGAQGAAADMQAQLTAAKQIFDIEQKRINLYDDADQKIKDNGANAKQAAESVYQAQAQYEESLDELREKNLEKYHKDAVSIFDALTNRQVGAGRALGLLLKKDALSEGGTLFGNVVGPMLQQAGQGVAGAIPGSWGKTLKGTMLDPGNKAIPDAAQAAIMTNTDKTVGWLAKIYQTISGQTSASDPSSADPASAISMAAANPLTNPLSAMSAMATSSLPAALSSGPLAAITKALGLAGGGIGSVFSGNALSNVLGLGTPGATTNLSGPLAGMSVALPGYAPTTGQSIASGVGLAATLGAGAFGIVSGLHAGGAGGALTAAGSAVGMAAAITTNVAKLMSVATPFLSAVPIIGSIAAIALPLIGSLLGSGPVQRANQINQELSANQYIAPQALNLTQSSNGNFTDFNARGQIRTSDFSAVPTVRQGSVWEQTHGLFGPPPTYYDVPGTQTGQFNPATAAKPTTVINVNAMDVASFADFADKHHIAIGNAAAKNLQNVHGALATEVHRTANG